VVHATPPIPPSRSSICSAPLPDSDSLTGILSGKFLSDCYSEAKLLPIQSGRVKPGGSMGVCTLDRAVRPGLHRVASSVGGAARVWQACPTGKHELTRQLRLPHMLGSMAKGDYENFEPTEPASPRVDHFCAEGRV
jgi:hypothetical protein